MSVCRRFRGAGGVVGAGNGAVVVVVDDVGIVDGGCAGVDGGVVAALAGAGGLVTGTVVGAGGPPHASEAMLQVLRSLVDVPASLSGCGGSSSDGRGSRGGSTEG